MKRTVAFLLFFLMSTGPASASSDVCDSSLDIPVNITPIFDNPTINTSHSIAAIQQMVEDPKFAVPTFDAASLGLAHYNPIFNFQAPITTRKMPDGSYCAKVVKVDATVGYENITIYIAHELIDNQCAVDHVLEHEKKHVAANLHVLQNYVPMIQTKLAEYLKTNGIYRGTDAEYAKELMEERIKFLFTEITKQISEENRLRQKEVDSPEEYAKTNTACDGYINTIVQQTLGKQRITGP